MVVAVVAMGKTTARAIIEVQGGSSGSGSSSGSNGEADGGAQKNRSAG